MLCLLVVSASPTVRMGFGGSPNEIRRRTWESIGDEGRKEKKGRFIVQFPDF